MSYGWLRPATLLDGKYYGTKMVQATRYNFHMVRGEECEIPHHHLLKYIIEGEMYDEKLYRY